MIAIATLAALGQAIHEAEIDAVIATLCLLAGVVILVAAGLATRPDWKPRRMREAERPLRWEKDLDAEEAQREPGHKESGSSG